MPDLPCKARLKAWIKSRTCWLWWEWSQRSQHSTLSSCKRHYPLLRYCSRERPRWMWIWIAKSPGTRWTPRTEGTSSRDWPAYFHLPMQLNSWFVWKTTKRWRRCMHSKWKKCCLWWPYSADPPWSPSWNMKWWSLLSLTSWLRCTRLWWWCWFWSWVYSIRWWFR